MGKPKEPLHVRAQGPFGVPLFLFGERDLNDSRLLGQGVQIFTLAWTVRTRCVSSGRGAPRRHPIGPAEVVHAGRAKCGDLSLRLQWPAPVPDVFASHEAMRSAARSDAPGRATWWRKVTSDSRASLTSRRDRRATESAQRTSSSETSRQVRYSGKSSVSARRLTRLMYRDLMKKLRHPEVEPLDLVEHDRGKRLDHELEPDRARDGPRHSCQPDQLGRSSGVDLDLQPG